MNLEEVRRTFKPNLLGDWIPPHIEEVYQIKVCDKGLRSFFSFPEVSEIDLVMTSRYHPEAYKLYYPSLSNAPFKIQINNKLRSLDLYPSFKGWLIRGVTELDVKKRYFYLRLEY